MDYDWLADQLIKLEYLEDGPELGKDECEKVLDAIISKIGGTYMLIVNVNIEKNGVYYDYLLNKSDKNKVCIEEWDNRYL